MARWTAAPGLITKQLTRAHPHRCLPSISSHAGAGSPISLRSCVRVARTGMGVDTPGPRAVETDEWQRSAATRYDHLRIQSAATGHCRRRRPVRRPDGAGIGSSPISWVKLSRIMADACSRFERWGTRGEHLASKPPALSTERTARSRRKQRADPTPGSGLGRV
jgi:hypothetical protein